MKLSIITINYNNISGLRKTIESVVNQTSLEFEYIVIDGASTDGSVEIIKDYKEKITYWISEPDTGIYDAMNKGIHAAKGTYCQFLNSGDYLVTPNVTGRMLFNLPDSSIVIGNMLKKLTSGKILRDKGIGNKKPTFLTFYKGTLNHSCAYIKRSLFDKYGYYDENLKIVSDWKFYLIAVGLNNEGVAYKDIDVTYFDMDGISNSNSTLVLKERKIVLEKLLPATVLVDYKQWSSQITRLERINRFPLAIKTLWLIERLLFKFEKHFRPKEKTEAK
ncbi:MAG: glycosyltransferase involved in cell wall biosynthesis [Polaribacter sp.]|jgi:glycosyltransferase involved in cell wall biosynthesis